MAEDIVEGPLGRAKCKKRVFDYFKRWLGSSENQTVVLNKLLKKQIKYHNNHMDAMYHLISEQQEGDHLESATAIFEKV